ncbi:hypothetical protein C8J57DRAFT_1384076 [Mycena rebaudengoi]|nr:hypothetical protein C8J57DRAFT_1384076 [Mycena rebaudengoi]
MCALFLHAAPIHLDTFLGQYPSRRELTATSFILASFFTSRPAPPPPRHPANSLAYLEGCRTEAHLETSWGAMRCHRALAKSHVLPTHYELEICLTPPECPLIQTSSPPPLSRTPTPTSRASHRPSRRPPRAPQARAPAALRGSSMQWRTNRARLYAVLPACGGQGVGLQGWCAAPTYVSAHLPITTVLFNSREEPASCSTTARPARWGVRWTAGIRRTDRKDGHGPERPNPFERAARPTSEFLRQPSGCAFVPMDTAGTSLEGD